MRALHRAKQNVSNVPAAGPSRVSPALAESHKYEFSVRGLKQKLIARTLWESLSHLAVLRGNGRGRGLHGEWCLEQSGRGGWETCFLN